MSDRRVVTLRAALGFPQLAPRAPELQLVHRWRDTWAGIGLVVAGMARQGWDVQLTRVTATATGGRRST